MFADLHIHTYFSDSTRSPLEVIMRAKAEGITLISCCDHNLVSAYDELISLCNVEGISLLVGAEISALFEGKEYHILGYGFDKSNKELLNLLEYSEGIYTDRDIQHIEKIAADYPCVSMDEFLHYGLNTVTSCSNN